MFHTFWIQLPYPSEVKHGNGKSSKNRCVKREKNIKECSIAMIHYQRLHHLSYPKPISLLHRYGGFLSHGGTPMVYNGKSYWNGLKFGGHPMSYLEPPLATQTSWDFHILPRHLALSRTAGMVWMASKSWSFSTGSLMYCSSNGPMPWLKNLRYSRAWDHWNPSVKPSGRSGKPNDKPQKDSSVSPLG